jgi:protein-S-isoprenylcysteine O-methyltransferase Ste14
VRFALFRRAVLARAEWNLTKTVVQLVVVWSLALGVGPFLISHGTTAWLGGEPLHFAAAPRAGLFLFVMSSAGGLWSSYVMALHGQGTPLPLDSPRRLVVVGPYGHIRNPMALTGVAQVLSVALALGSGAVAVYGVGGGLLWNFVLRPLEERDLEATFGAAYVAYRRRVPCWIPCLRAYRPTDSVA